MKRRLASQPRIAGIKREYGVGALHPDVRHGLQEIALEEGKSVSWVMAEIISAFFGIDCVTGRKLRTKFRYIDVPQHPLDAKGQIKAL